MSIKNICGGFNNIFNEVKQNPMEQRVDFFVNEKLALELVIAVSFQQVKKIIRSETKQLVRDQYLRAGKCKHFFKENAPLCSPSSQEKQHIVCLLCSSISLSPPWCSFI